ncbi:MAG: hypothetical protein ACTJGM_03810 [Fusobacterium sp.]
MKIKKIISSYLPNKIRYGNKYSEFLNFLFESEKYSKEEIKKWQLKKLNSLLFYCNENIPYYTKIFKSNKIKLPFEKLDDIKKIPYLTKDLIRENYKDLISKELNNIPHNISTTGGSTGTPLKLCKSKISQIKEIIFLDYYMIKMGFKGYKIKKATIRGPIPKYGISERIGLELILSSYLISEETIKNYILELERFNPEYIHVYPSSIYMIAKIIKNNNLKINIPNLKLIFSSSEIFSIEQKKLVSEVFKCKILDWYSNTERSVLATNIYGEKSYKMDQRYSYVEIVDKEIISTTFNDLAMPLIRYKTGDEVEYINNKDFIIKGRVQDYIYGKNKEKYPVVGIIFGQHFSCFGDINNFQIYQKKIGEIEFRIESNFNLEKSKELEIKNSLQNATNKSLNVIIKYVNKIERTKRGKYKFLIQELEEKSNEN